MSTGSFVPIESNDSLVVSIIKDKLNKCGGRTTINLLQGKPCEIWFDKTGNGLVSPKIPKANQLVWEAFDAAVELIIKNGGQAAKGKARSGAKLGSADLPLNSLEGYIAYKVHGLKEGDTSFGPGFAIAAVLDWVNICKNERGQIAIQPSFLKKFTNKDLQIKQNLHSSRIDHKKIHELSKSFMEQSNEVSKINKIRDSEYKMVISRPSNAEINKYLSLWSDLENYSLQEKALEKLFLKTYPENKNIDEVIIKVSVLNDFYSTNIFSSYLVAKHIIGLNIDDRLQKGDATLVNELARVEMKNGAIKNFYSFATKYCSHHNPSEFSIYDSYLNKILRFYRDSDRFYKFKNEELKNYVKYKKILLEFKSFYSLEDYNLKEIDKYLWLLGKEKFPNKYY